VTAGLLGVDHQGVPAPGETPTEIPLGPGYADEWFDLGSRRMVSA
jgi:hypothetical protein